MEKPEKPKKQKKQFSETLLWGPPYPKESRNIVFFCFFWFLCFFFVFWFWGLGGVPIDPGGSLPSTKPKVFLMSFQFYNKMVQYMVYNIQESRYNAGTANKGWLNFIYSCTGPIYSSKAIVDV